MVFGAGTFRRIYGIVIDRGAIVSAALIGTLSLRERRNMEISTIETTAPQEPTCPQCAHAALAVAVSHSTGQRTITFECQTCHYLWEITAADDHGLSPRRRIDD
ncbi:MAG TPA: hypothetical protein VJP86_15555 [Vicinamibacterales bacterium]|jgi:hypothetical protein|nr:hypothetical protein [Vicinamibacterales bacterium]